MRERDSNSKNISDLFLTLPLYPSFVINITPPRMIHRWQSYNCRYLAIWWFNWLNKIRTVVFAVSSFVGPVIIIYHLLNRIYNYLRPPPACILQDKVGRSYFLLQGIVNVISLHSPFIEWTVWFTTTVPLKLCKTKNDYKWMNSMFSN